MPHIIVLGSFVDSITNFRGDLIRDLVASGFRVTAMAPFAAPHQLHAIHALGADFSGYHVSRNGLSALDDLKTYQQLRKSFSKLKPDIVLAYTIKPVIWGGLAIRSFPRVRFFPMITGLGYAFHGDSLRRKCLQKLVVYLYSKALERAQHVFFQNKDNRDLFVNREIVTGCSTTVLPGSGVNLKRFEQKPLPEGNTTFLMIARLLGEKGVREFVAAAKVVKLKHPSVMFRLVGMEDPSPDGIRAEEIERWKGEGGIDFVGPLADVRPALANCHVFVLPSCHEGMPRTVLEAMATGRAIITSDVPGCRDTVVNGRNGFLVESKNSVQLAEAMIRFIDEPSLIGPMGTQSRITAEQVFSVDRVNRMIIDRLTTPSDSLRTAG